ncbi:MAG: NADH:flavin oxidoreductase [Pseudomonadales bacterium]
MWKPAERIKYQPQSGQWPSAEQARDCALFSPIQAGPMAIEERTWVPAMVPWRATDDGFVSADVLQWYERFARGRPGVIVVEATGIRDIASGPLLRIGHDRYIPGLKKLADVVRDASGGHTRLLIQIIDFLTIRRRPQREKFFRQYLNISDSLRQRLNAEQSNDEDIREQLLALPDAEIENVLEPRDLEALQMGYRERVTDTELAHINELPAVLPDLFAGAARRAHQAGFDGVELHYAHAYTMASFLSAKNQRQDGYGGARENRARLPLEVFRRVRDAVPENFAVGCRYLSDECIDGGNNVEDAAYFGVEFARAGMDFISLSRGGKFEDAKQPKAGWAAYPYTGRSGYECMPQYISDAFGPFGRNTEPVAAIRHAIRTAGFETPIVLSGGIHNFSQAEAVLREDKADIVGFARQALADPDWFEKVRLGYGEQVVLCKYSNYCEGLDQKHKQVTCELWDRKALDEPGIALSIDGKRRLTAPLWERKKNTALIASTNDAN